MSLVADITRSSQIRFRSKSPNDNNLYHGNVIGECDYKLAKRYGDIYTYNTQVITQDPTVPVTELLDFIMIELLVNVDGLAKFMIPFAKQWINEATLDIISTQAKIDMTVFDAGNNDIENILALLRAAGYKASVTKVY